MTPEGLILNQICSWLSWRKCLFTIHDSVGIFDPTRKVFRSNNSPYRKKGWPDIIGIWAGKFLGIEVKSKTGRLSPEQRERLEEINRHGGIAFMARSLDEVIAKLEGEKT